MIKKSFKVGESYELKRQYRSFRAGQKVTIESVNRKAGECTAKMPDGSVQTLLLTMLIREVGPSLFALLATAIQRLHKKLFK